MHTFTREFYHPQDRTTRSSAEAVDRFLTDHKRFPPAAYEAESLLWKQDEWRQPTPMERAQIHGLPPGLVQAIQAETSSQKIARQNSIVGNGFHLPSVMLVLLILFQLAPAADTASVYLGLPDAQESALRQRICHTAFDQQVVKAFPGVLTSKDLMASMQAQLPMVPPSHMAWRCTHKWDQYDIRLLQAFWIPSLGPASF